MAAIVEVQTKLFAALEEEDQQAWERLTVRDFVAFEGGQRYGRTGVFDLVRSAHAAGRHFQWSVADPRLETACTVATLIYVNHGAITEGASRSDISWLETATLRYGGGGWRVVFMESMRENTAN